MVTTVETEIGGKRLILETGLMAKQANGAVVVRYGDTVVLSTAVSSKVERANVDFLPLTVDYQEKAYAAGRIPGGFFKREGRQTEKEILTSRLIDRPIRPLFPEGYYFDTQVIASVLSIGDESSMDLMGMIASSAALAISDIPFRGPIGAVRIGLIDGTYIINPGQKATRGHAPQPGRGRHCRRHHDGRRRSERADRGPDARGPRDRPP